MKRCRTCKLSEPLVTFGKNAQERDGKHWACKQCWNAYLAERRLAHGIKPMQPFLIRLWSNIQQCGHEDLCPYCCWPWLKGRDVDGYGFIAITNQRKHHTYRVSRIVWEIWHGRLLPDDMQACHYCDNPPCANPAHLWAGTILANRADCVQKGRHAQGDRIGSHLHPEIVLRGEAHLKAKLTAQQVQDIRTAHSTGITMADLSRWYGVSKFNIRCIVLRKTWKHI